MIVTFTGDTLAEITKYINEFIQEEDKKGNSVILNNLDMEVTNLGFKASVNYESINDSEFI